MTYNMRKENQQDKIHNEVKKKIAIRPEWIMARKRLILCAFDLF